MAAEETIDAGAERHEAKLKTVAVAEAELLQHYRQERLELADSLLALMHLAEGRRDAARAGQLRALAARLAEDRFQLAVVGQFSRGKSTLMNAILGAPYLPAGVLPMTSIITTVGYGSHAKATIRLREGRTPIEASLDELPRYIAQASAIREELGVASASIELPAEILRLGFSFVDTPGVGSAILTNTEATLGFLPEADAAIFVMSFDSPLGEAELAFLGAVAGQVRQIFLVLNKRDLVEEREAHDVEAFVLEKVRGAGVLDPRVFALSARDALAAKQAGDVETFRQSGLPELEAELCDYLTTAKSQEFLLRIGERAERFVAALRSEAEIAERAAADRGARDEVEEGTHELFLRSEMRRHQLLGQLGEVIAGQLAELRDATVPTWREELLALAHADAELARSARKPTEVPARLDQLGPHLQDTIDAWATEAVSRWNVQLRQAVAAPLLAVTRLPGELESEVARCFGNSPSADRSEEDDRRPRLAAARARWTIIQPRKTALSRSRASALIDQAIVTSMEQYLAELDEAVARATTEWLGALDRWSTSALRDMAEHLRVRLLTPFEPSAMSELATLAQALTAVRDRVTSSEHHRSHEHAGHGDGLPTRTTTEPEKASGCVLCERLVHALFDFMSRYQFELATSVERRNAHAASGGFCAVHTWYYAEIGSSVGVSASYARLSEAVAAKLNAAADDGSDLARLEQAVDASRASRATCAACLALDDVRSHALDEIAGRLIGAVESTTPPLCLDHVAALLANGIDLTTGQALVRATARRLQRRAEDMRTYSLKRETLRRALLDREEESARFDALIRLVGDPLLVCAARHESEFRSPYRGAAG